MLVWDGYFIAVPALVTVCGFLVLRLVVASTTAVLLSLTQFASWIFLELSAVGSDLLVIGWAFAAAVTASCCGLLLLLFMLRPATFLGRHWFTLQVALIAAPMAAVASWDLLRRDLVLAQWEGLHYLWLGIPVLLVTVGHHLADRADRAEAEAAGLAASQ